MSYYRTKSSPFITSHCREFNLRDFNQHPEWIVRTPEEFALYEKYRELKVTDMLPKNSPPPNLAEHMDKPSLMWDGYPLPKRSLLYETTSQASYGRLLPTAFEMPDAYFALSQKFTSMQLARGMEDRGWSFNGYVAGHPQ